MLHTDTARFIVQALEATIFLCPEDAGLTEAELVAAGQAFASKDTPKGRILDTLRDMDGATKFDRKGRYHLHGLAGLMDLAYFGDSFEPDLRNIAAFDFVHDYFVHLADENQFHNAKATRDQISGAAAGNNAFTPQDLQAAVTIWLEVEFLYEKDGLIAFRSDPRTGGGMRPSDQLAHNRSVGRAAARRRPDFDRTFAIVKDMIQNRGAPAAPAAASGQGAGMKLLDDDVAAALQKLGPELVNCYRQGIGDLQQKGRVNFVGPAAELREVLTWVLHTLAPNEAVCAQPGFKAEHKEGHPTRRERSEFILKTKLKHKPECRRTLDNINNGLDRLASDLYSRASGTTHTPAGDLSDLTTVATYLNAFLRDLLL